jgi:hypothetical protein
MMANGFGLTTLGNIIRSLGISHGCGLSGRSHSTQWRELEKQVGIAVRETTNTVVKDNLEREIQATLKHNPECKDEQYGVPITVSSDSGWQKRSSGHRYDSGSSHCIMFGGRTNQCIAYEVFSKFCAQCDNSKNNCIGTKETIAPCSQELGHEETDNSQSIHGESQGMVKEESQETLDSTFGSEDSQLERYDENTQNLLEVSENLLERYDENSQDLLLESHNLVEKNSQPNPITQVISTKRVWSMSLDMKVAQRTLRDHLNQWKSLETFCWQQEFAELGKRGCTLW